MKKNKIILFSFLGLIAASLISIPIQTELSVREAKNRIKTGVGFDELKREYGEFVLVEPLKKQKAYLSDTKLTIQEGQKLWVNGQEGLSYWNILIITDETDHVITGDVDRLW